MTNVTPVSANPEVALAPTAAARVPEPSMFDVVDWINNPDPVQQPGPKFAGVRFQPVGKVYTYIADAFPQLKVGDWVIVDTQRGKQMGQVATVKRPRNVGDMSSYKRIERLAGGRDMVMRHYYENKELEAMIACRAESKTLDMPIKIVRAEYSFDGQSLTFLFSSDQEERIETNDLRQVMGRLYRARIDFRQISPREVAKVIGGMGACGIEQRCCSRFLTDFSPISIKHAKEQGLSLNPHDITGMCGRLRCCLIYEYEQYVEARRQLPKKNAIVGTPSGQGKVVDHMPMRDSVLVVIGEGEAAKAIEVHRQDIVPLEELKRLQDKAASGTCDKHEGGNCDCGKNKVEGQAEAAQEQAIKGAVDAVAREAQPNTAQDAPTSSDSPRQPKQKNKGKGTRSAGVPVSQPRPDRPARQPGQAQPEGQNRPDRTERPNRQNRQDQQARPDREQRGQQGQPAANKPNQQATGDQNRSSDQNRGGDQNRAGGQNRHTLIRPKHVPDRVERAPRPGKSGPRRIEPERSNLSGSRDQNQVVEASALDFNARDARPQDSRPPTGAENATQDDQQNRQPRRPLRRPLQRHPSSTGATGSSDQPPQSTQES